MPSTRRSRCRPTFRPASHVTHRSTFRKRPISAARFDPWAGSYYVESLTNEIVHKAWNLIQEVEKLGGMAKAIETGIPKMRIEEAAARKQARIDSGIDTIVGINRYRLEKEDPIDILDVDNTAVRESQIKRLNELRANRDEAKVKAALAAITEWREDQERQSARTGRRGRQSPRIIGRDLRCLRRGRRPLQSRYPFHFRCIFCRSEKRRKDLPKPRLWPRSSRKRRAANPVSWWLNWVRTVTTAAPR